MKTFIKNSIFPIIVFFCSIHIVSAQSSDQNYIRTRVPLVAKQKAGDLDTMAYTRLQTSIQYFDGLGRPLQTIQKQATTNAKDIVQPFEYDVYGREVRKYLPYSNVTGSQDGSYKTNALTAGQGVWAHYKLTTQSIDTTSFPFAETMLEASPLNRVTENGAPGKAFRVLKNASGASTLLGNTVKTEYASNTATEVKLWKLTANGATGTTNYGVGQLYKTILKDENWKAADLQHGTVEEFKDKAGRVVLKRTFNKTPQGATETLSTYYVYDDLGNLRYVIPPAVSATSFSESLTDNTFNNFIYAYRYDSRQRVIEKKIPGAWWVHLVYNKIDQLVFTQDSVQRKNKEWLFTKYDAMGRVILTGIYADTARRSTLQTRVNGQTASLWESRGSAHYGYTKGALPTTAMKVLVANYYDDYNFAVPTGYTYMADSLNTQSLMTRGLLTGAMVRVLNSTDSLWRVNYYDSKGQVVQVHRQNYIGGKDVINTRYSFTGQPLVVKRVHTNSKGTGTQTFLTWYTYDHMSRKTRTREKIINGTINATGQPVVLADYAYNELGQLITKKLHRASDGSYAQTVDYQYNIRGWLKKVNDPAAVTGVLTGTADKFGLELKYDNGPVPQFNGNVSDMIWKGSYRDTLQEYSFAYDKLNRLLKAQSMQGGLSNNYQERIDGYDLMGNITKLSRRSRNVLIDSLVYSYKNSNGSNQLDRVDEFSNAATAYKNLGFSEPVGMQQAGEYTYDANGNLLTDKNGLITAISYNYLNLPQSITKNGTTVSYVYDATGRKLRKTVGTTSEEYVDGLQLQTFNGTTTINFITTEEGRASWNGASNPYYYRYNLTDHLGNVRVTVNEAGTLEQEDSYFAFGLQMPGKSYTPSPANKYLYNGKELQSETGWYDYGARFFDPTLGRWHAVDPLAEKIYNWTPYRYALNNPLKFIDVNGKIEWPLKGVKVVNKKDDPHGAWGLKNTVVRTSTYMDTDRPIGATNPHIGIDYRASVGTNFYNLGNGTVSEIGKTKKGAKYIVVEYSNGDKVRFLHINSVSNGIKVGSRVYEGQILGTTGTTGTKFAHLHVDATDQYGNRIDPENQNYGEYTNEEFFNSYGGDYSKLPNYDQESSEDGGSRRGFDDYGLSPWVKRVLIKAMEKAGERIMQELNDVLKK